MVDKVALREVCGVWFISHKTSINGHSWLYGKGFAKCVGTLRHPNGSWRVAAHGCKHRILQVRGGVAPRRTVMLSRPGCRHINDVAARLRLQCEGIAVGGFVGTNVNVSLLYAGIAGQIGLGGGKVISTHANTGRAGLESPISNGIVGIHTRFRSGVGEVRVSESNTTILLFQGNGTAIGSGNGRIDNIEDTVYATGFELAAVTPNDGIVQGGAYRR